MDRQTLRTQILEKRLSWSDGKIREISLILQERLLKSGHWPTSGRIGLYYPMKNEVRTQHLFQSAIESGLRVYFPRVEQGLNFYEVNGPDDLHRGAYGIQEPNAKCERLSEEAKIDLMIVPGVVFDPCGYRLGYGRGFYDRYLSLGLVEKTLGLAFDFQITDDIQKEKWDIPLDVILTERREFSQQKDVA